MTSIGGEVPGPVEALTRPRLATWNLNHWRQPLLPTNTRRAAWEHLKASIGAQVALVQEAVPPLELGRDRAVYREIAGHRNWGSAVVALDSIVSIEPLRSVRVPFSRRRFLLENSHPGSVAVAQLFVAGIQPITPGRPPRSGPVERRAQSGFDPASSSVRAGQRLAGCHHPTWKRRLNRNRWDS